MAIVGVLPAAGYAVRLQPLDCSKEMLEVNGRPVIDYLVERMRTAGCDELRVVTRPEKEDVVSYAEEIGASVFLGHPGTINDSFATGMSGLDPETIVLLGFPDSLWEPADGFRPLVEAVQVGEQIALGLFEAPGLEGSDFLDLDDAGRVRHIEIKPARPPSDWIWGCAAALVGALEGLEREEWPSAFLNSLLRRGQELFAVPLSSAYLDIGTRTSLRLAREGGWTLSS
jgi:glucose-1-phosphate thymidylyltransferase